MRSRARAGGGALARLRQAVLTPTCPRTGSYLTACRSPGGANLGAQAHSLPLT
ncbi:MAG: hypothetical protein MUC97_18800 [Bernardetiaceae bacterium]|nr:hypothetical protein [Bernardetiaceae bacterium]